MTSRRNRISPELMEALQLLKYSIQKERGLDFTLGLDWADELKELEFEADLHKGCPEDVRNFIEALGEPVLP